MKMERKPMKTEMKRAIQFSYDTLEVEMKMMPAPMRMMIKMKMMINDDFSIICHTIMK